MFNRQLKCPFCGTSDPTISIGSKCHGCGRYISEKRCLICRQERKFSSDNQAEGCWTCGAIFTNNANVSGDAFSMIVEEGTVERERMVPCGNCGSLMEEYDVVCRNCGALKSH